MIKIEDIKELKHEFECFKEFPSEKLKSSASKIVKALVYAEQIQAERDALAAQVKQFRLIFRSENLSQNETAIALQKMASSVDMLPEQCLATHDAEVAENAVNDFCEWMLLSKRYSVAEWCGEYTNQLRTKVKP